MCLLQIDSMAASWGRRPAQVVAFLALLVLAEAAAVAEGGNDTAVRSGEELQKYKRIIRSQLQKINKPAIKTILVKKILWFGLINRYKKKIVQINALFWLRSRVLTATSSTAFQRTCSRRSITRFCRDRKQWWRIRRRGLKDTKPATPPWPTPEAAEEYSSSGAAAARRARRAPFRYGEPGKKTYSEPARRGASAESPRLRRPVRNEIPSAEAMRYY